MNRGVGILLEGFLIRRRDNGGSRRSCRWGWQVQGRGRSATVIAVAAAAADSAIAAAATDAGGPVGAAAGRRRRLLLRSAATRCDEEAAQVVEEFLFLVIRIRERVDETAGLSLLHRQPRVAQVDQLTQAAGCLGRCCCRRRRR